MDLRALVLLSILSTAQQDVVLTMTSGEQCFGSRVTLLCTHPDPLADSVKYLPQLINWAVDDTTIDFGDPSNEGFTPTRLSSTATTLSFTVTEEDHRDRAITCTCFLVLNNANRDHEESNVVTMDALGECSVSVQAVWNENSAVVSGVRSTQISIPSPTAPADPTSPNVGGPDNTLIIIIVIVVVIVVVVLIIVIAVVTICLCRNKPKVPAPNPPKKDFYEQVDYAKVYILNDRPCKPPRIPDVEYTEAMGPGQKVITPPPDSLPPKKGVKRYIKPDPIKSNELRMEVVAILQQKKIVHGSLDPDEPVVGTYQNKTFVANFVYFEDDRWDVPEREIDEMVKMRDHQGTDMGLLVTNMETLPSNLLEKLEEQHCHFMGVGRIEQLTDNALMRKFDIYF